MSGTDPTSPDFGRTPPPPSDAPVFPPSPGYGAPPPPASPFPSYGAPPPPAAGYPAAAPSGSAYPTGPASMPPVGNPYANPSVVAGASVDIPGGGPVPTMVTRLLARIIDAVILGVAFGIVSAIGIGGLSAVGSDGTASVFAVGAFLTTMVILGVIGLAYEVVLIALRGATLGKQVMGIKVVQTNGSIPGWGPSLIRWGVPFVGSFLCGIGQLVVYLSPFFADQTGRQRGWHDQAANTIVVSARH